MGEMVRVRCDGCDIDRQDFLGWGMNGDSRTLCACIHCRRLVVKNGRWTSQGEEPALLRCPYCKRKLERLFPRGRAELDGQRALGTCPKCSGSITGELVGIWD